ncbi:MAG: hypothetical protein K2Q26_08450 [Bdellovibrionales bacterium]|nr:hypothetical protein [Bdellovibrionales bacterium]
MLKNQIFIGMLCLILVGCGSGGDSGGGGTITSQPDPYCSTVTSYPGGITVTGDAEYEFRINGNGAITGSPLPIRQAEIMVLDASGAIIQCGATDNSGNFSITVPNTSANYLLRINSRIENSLTKAYVMNNPSNKDHYFIEKSFNPTTSTALGTFTAEADGDIKGGAFNILDKILAANIYLQTTTNNCSTTFSDCVPFTGAPLAHVYWTKGFNPGTYFNAGPVSFYLPGANELYILGGQSNDVDSSDTDHFDNSIILHEYGHFIEDNFSITNSPGGSHSGNSIIDARLAFGEGWGNFFQAAVLNNPVYRDTAGTPLGSTSVYFNENLETPGNDQPSVLGEGNFREFSIARMFWDAIDAVNEGAGVDQVTSSFAELWAVFAGPTAGFKSSALRFRNIGLFHSIQQTLSGGSNWSSIRTGELQRGDQTDYIRPVTTGSSCSAIPIQAANISGSQIENGSATNSNQFASNDFYQINHAGGVLTLGLSYTTSGGATANLDLYVFPEKYVFGSSSSILASSTNPISSGATSGTESISTNLAAGVYVINVRVNTSVRLGSGTSYSMTLNGVALCPN